MAQHDSSSSWKRDKHLDSVCDAFEKELVAGSQPKMSQYLQQAAAGSQEAMLEELLAIELEYRDKNGLGWERSDFVSEFADHADLVQRVIEDHLNRGASRELVSGQDTGTIAGDDTDAAISQSLTPGRTVGQYLLEEEIGTGGMGIVFRARQTGTDRTVALKFINTVKLPRANRTEALDRFLQEPKAAARLEHDNIVTVYAFGEADGLPFFAMRLIDGPSLRDMTQEGPLDCRKAARYVRDIADAIDHAHQHDVLHRDIKPGNILIGSDDRPYITDFGMAKSLSEGLELTREGIGMGTIGYVSPEQAEDAARADARSDVYSLGATLYCLVTARPPFQAAEALETLRQVREVEPVSPRRLNAAVDRDLETICLKCLAKNAADRYQAARDLAADLDRYLKDEPIVARPVGAMTRVWRWSRRHRLVAALSLSLAITLIGLAVGGPLAALAVYQSSQAKRELEAQNYVDTAGLASQRGQWDLALPSLERALELGYGDETELQIQKVRALQALGRGKESSEILDRLAHEALEGPHEAELRLLLGDDLLRRGKLSEGTDEITRALVLGLPAADAAYARGMLAKDSPTALRHFQEAVDHAPFHHAANGSLVLCQILLGHHEAAAARSSAMIHLYPEDPTFHIALAWLAAIRGDIEEANNQLKQTRQQLDDERLETLETICSALAMLDQYAADWDGVARLRLAVELTKFPEMVAPVAADTALRLPPSLAPNRANMELFMSQANLDLKKAAESLNEAIKIHPEGTLYFTLGIELVGASQGHNQDDLLAAKEAFLAASKTPAMRRPDGAGWANAAGASCGPRF